MKYILVTGAFGGMGRATVRLLKEQGFCVFALDRNVGEAEQNIIPLQADITDEQSIKAAAESVKKITDELLWKWAVKSSSTFSESIFSAHFLSTRYFCRGFTREAG